MGDSELALRNVSDLAAARVMAYTEADRLTVCDLVQECFSSPSEYNKKFDTEIKENENRIKSNPFNYYRATHMMVSLKKGDLIGIYRNLSLHKCDLQITNF